MANRDGLIRGLGDELARTLAAAGQLRQHPDGELVLREGDGGDSLFVILSGRVRVFVSDAAGHEMVLGHHGPGEIVGELALDGKPRSASVRACGPVACAHVPHAVLARILARRPAALQAFLARLAARARSATLQVKDLALLDVYGRIARLLLQIEDEAARGGVRERLTLLEIASRVGASRDMVGKIVKDLLAGGYIAREGKRITVLRRPPARW